MRCSPSLVWIWFETTLVVRKMRGHVILDVGQIQPISHPSTRSLDAPSASRRQYLFRASFPRPMSKLLIMMPGVTDNLEKMTVCGAPGLVTTYFVQKLSRSRMSPISYLLSRSASFKYYSLSIIHLAR